MRITGRHPRGAAGRRGRWSRLRLAAAALALAAAAVAAVSVAAAGGGGHAGRRAVTADEANRLAITRFRNYQAGGRAVTITVPSAAGGLVVTASVDFRAGIGYGVVRGTGRDSSSDGLIQWTRTTVLVRAMAGAPAAAPAAPPATGWYGRPLTAAGSSLDSALAITLGLGSDRPDNAELLPQNGALWLGRDHVRGHPAEIMSGPRARADGASGASGASGAPGASGASGDSSGASGTSGVSGSSGTVRYWIGADGTMYRVRADVASEPQPVVVDFDTHAYVPVRPVPALEAAR